MTDDIARPQEDDEFTFWPMEEEADVVSWITDDDRLKTLQVEALEFISTTRDNDQRLIPTIVLVLNDDDDFWKEEIIDKVYEEALLKTSTPVTEDDPYHETYPVYISGIENYTDNIITVQLGKGNLDNIYMTNIQVQYLQVARLFSKVWKLPTFYITSVSEYQHIMENAPFSEAPISSSEFLLSASFPDLSEEAEESVSQAMNLQMYNKEGDVKELYDQDSSDLLRRIFPVKIYIEVSAEERDQIRAELLDNILGLMRGDMDALSVLYGFAEELDDAVHQTKEKLPLRLGHRHALHYYDFMGKLFQSTNPSLMVRNKEDSDRRINPNETPQEIIMNDGGELEALMESFIDSYVMELADNDPEGLIDFIPSLHGGTDEARNRYLQTPSNIVPLLGLLKNLEPEISMDSYRQMDWNEPESCVVENYGTDGEFLIIMAVLNAQRLLMLSQITKDHLEEKAGSGGAGYEGLEESPALASLIIQAVTEHGENGSWVIEQGIARLGTDAPLVLEEMMKFLLATADSIEEILEGSVGIIVHTFGHRIVNSGLSAAAFKIVFETVPLVSAFAEGVISKTAELKAEEQGEDEECPVYSVFIDMVKDYSSYSEFLEIVLEVITGIKLFGSFMVDMQTNEMRDTPEWTNALVDYFKEFLFPEL